MTRGKAPAWGLLKPAFCGGKFTGGLGAVYAGMLMLGKDCIPVAIGCCWNLYIISSNWFRSIFTSPRKVCDAGALHPASSVGAGPDLAPVAAASCAHAFAAVAFAGLAAAEDP